MVRRAGPVESTAAWARRVGLEFARRLREAGVFVERADGQILETKFLSDGRAAYRWRCAVCGRHSVWLTDRALVAKRAVEHGANHPNQPEN